MMANAQAEMMYRVHLTEDEASRLLRLLAHMEDGDPLDSIYEALSEVVPNGWDYPVEGRDRLEAKGNLETWSTTTVLRFRK